MKLFAIILAFALYAFALVHSLAISDTNVKCQMNCDLQDYKPVCGTDDAGETKSFNNLCILKTENCLRQLSFQKTADGECP
ncbi:turripeptide Gsg9.2 [Anastrepha obliqua]|uniref:turripeptide Gsg9.2 n=1 Tax=Anastrepha obliqua TaxID=95512 RepID=UPI002409F23E|nr:turripeptide Gsg9.2 [Anastrepha obliqua]